MERLDAARIDVPGVAVRILERCASTNSALLEGSGDLPALLAAEEQTAGRGRRGRRWHSSPGGDITFSLARRMARPARELPALSLVAGVAVATVLRAQGAPGVTLKWPNDLMVDGAKLGGILVETRADRAVVGVGINCRAAPGLERRLRRRVAVLQDAHSRNHLIQEIARGLLAALERFDKDGFEALRTQWESMDAHAGQRLRVRLADGRSLSGIGAGLAPDGALRLRTRRGERDVRNGRIVSAGVA
jgi:BirA family biotin operon repressor/biotin-[acetyl-CoA-carboxylase] ligase